MNIYPMWWDSTVTIYNKYTDSVTRKITWYRTIIPNAFWNYVGDKVTIGETVLDTNHTVCRIRKSNNFLEAYKWNALGNDERARYFTLGVGDIIIKGEVDDDIDEYTSGHRSGDILSKYKKMQGGMIIEHIAINVGGGRHSEHYSAKGL